MVKKRQVFNESQYAFAKEMYEKRKNAVESKRTQALIKAIEVYENPELANDYVRKEYKPTPPKPKDPLKVELTYDELWLLNSVCVKKEFANKEEFQQGKDLLIRLIGKKHKVPTIKLACLSTLIKEYEKPVPIIKTFRCASKTAFDTKEQARMALRDIREKNATPGKRRRKIPIRSYECTYCGKYHLTSMPYKGNPSKP